VKHPEIGIVFNNPSYEKYESVIASGGLLAVNASLIQTRSKRHDITCLMIPATKIADHLGSIRLTNMVMLGAVLAQRPILNIESVKRALEQHSHHKELLEQNYAALESGAEFVAQELVAL
jgi:2-oxoglutarate ferredoxin oxidoreductase subunit gamma